MRGLNTTGSTFGNKGLGLFLSAAIKRCHHFERFLIPYTAPLALTTQDAARGVPAPSKGPRPADQGQRLRGTGARVFLQLPSSWKGIREATPTIHTWEKAAYKTDPTKGPPAADQLPTRPSFANTSFSTKYKPEPKTVKSVGGWFKVIPKDASGALAGKDEGRPPAKLRVQALGTPPRFLNALPQTIF